MICIDCNVAFPTNRRQLVAEATSKSSVVHYSCQHHYAALSQVISEQGGWSPGHEKDQLVEGICPDS